MLAKITSKNQITIPKKIIDQFPETQYFDVEFTCDSGAYSSGACPVKYFEEMERSEFN